MTTKTRKPDCCRITIINDVFGTRQDIDSPQSVEEALDNHGSITAAFNWYCRYSDDDSMPIGVALRRDDERIIARNRQ